MNEERRATLREMRAQIEALELRIREVWIGEDVDYESRSEASKASAQGVASKEAIEGFSRISDALTEAMEQIDATSS